MGRESCFDTLHEITITLKHGDNNGVVKITTIMLDVVPWRYLNCVKTLWWFLTIHILHGWEGEISIP